MRPRRIMLTTSLVVVALAGIAACGGSGSGGPDEPRNGGGAPNEEEAVLIAQGQSPTINGLSISLSSVREDEAAMQIFGHADETEIVRGRPGDMIPLNDFRLEVVDVEDNDEGGFVKLRVIAPKDG